MSALRKLATVTGWTCVGIGAVQLIGGVRAEPGMADDDATVDSHVRFMGPVFMGYGLTWLDAGRGPQPNLQRLRLLAGLLALGGAGRIATRATIGPPTRFHDGLLAVELAAPAILEAVARRDRSLR